MNDTLLRDLFAAVALGRLVEAGPLHTVEQQRESGPWPDEAARMAYAFADAMLKARAAPYYS